MNHAPGIPIGAVLLYLIGFDILRGVLTAQNPLFDYLSLPFCIVILVVFLVYAYFLGLKRTNMRQLYSELSIFVGAELGVAGGFAYAYPCRPPPGPLGATSCPYAVNLIGNSVGLAIFVFGIIASAYYENNNRINAEVPQIAIRSGSASVPPPPYPGMTQGDVPLPPMHTFVSVPEPEMPLSLTMGGAAGFLMVLFDWWFVFYGVQTVVRNLVMSYGLVSMALWFTGLPIFVPLAAGAIAHFKYHNITGMARFLAGEFIVLTIGAALFIVLVMFAAAFTAGDGQVILAFFGATRSFFHYGRIYFEA